MQFTGIASAAFALNLHNSRSASILALAKPAGIDKPRTFVLSARSRRDRFLKGGIKHLSVRKKNDLRIAHPLFFTRRKASVGEWDCPCSPLLRGRRMAGDDTVLG